jgi:hypothetical protein
VYLWSPVRLYVMLSHLVVMLNEIAQQISKIIGTSLGEADDEAVLEELAELEAEEALKVSGSLPSVPVVPVAGHARTTGVHAPEKVSAPAPAAAPRQRVAVPA